MFHVLARYDGFCAGCDVEAPLVLIERGPRGVRAWLAGIGSEDRSLTYTCRVCGRNEHVPLTETEDALYDATLPTWPDTVFALPRHTLPSYTLPEVEYADFDGADIQGADFQGADFQGAEVAHVAEVAWVPAAGDVFAEAALHLASAPLRSAVALHEPQPLAEQLVAFVPECRRPFVRRIEALPRQRVHATDGLPLSLAVA